LPCSEPSRSVIAVPGAGHEDSCVTGTRRSEQESGVFGGEDSMRLDHLKPFLRALGFLVAVSAIPMPALRAQTPRPEAAGQRPDAPVYAKHGPYWVGIRQVILQADGGQAPPASRKSMAVLTGGTHRSFVSPDLPRAKFGSLDKGAGPRTSSTTSRRLSCWIRSKATPAPARHCFPKR